MTCDRSGEEAKCLCNPPQFVVSKNNSKMCSFGEFNRLNNKQPCRKVIVIPLLLLSSEDNLRMNCSPVCLSNDCGPGLHRKLWGGFLQVNRRWLSLPGLPGIISVVVYDSGSALVKLSFIFPIPPPCKTCKTCIYLIKKWWKFNPQ